MAITGVALAQGTVNWGAFIPTFISAQTNSTSYSPLMGGGSTGGGAIGGTGLAAESFYYQLLYTTYSGNQATIGTLADLLTWSDAGLNAINSSAAAGRLVGNPLNTGATVPWATGTTSSIVLVGWSANLGTDWATVSTELNNGTYQTILNGENGFLGVSATGYIAAGGSNPGTTVFNSAATAQGLPIFSPNTQLYLLPAVPEPATFALAGLGGLSLLLFRRRQQK